MGWEDNINDYSSAPKIDRRQEMDDMRAIVKPLVDTKFKKDKNPVTQFLLEVGVLEDMEVLHRLIMDAADNKAVYLYKNKLDAIKSYVTTIKETVVIQEKQAKVDSATGGMDDDYGEINIKFEREM